MTMQIRRTRVVNRAPTDLVPGQLAVEMASNPPRLWTGVPTDIDASGRREIMGTGGGGGGWRGEFPGAELIYESPTMLRLIRRNGGYIRHNGELHLIPPDGIVIPQLPSALFRDRTLYLFLTGNLQPSWQTTTAEFTHRPSVTPGNEGTEVVVHDSIGEVGTLLGLIRIGADGEFVDEPRRRFVRSWFNRKPISLRGDDIAQAVYGGTGAALAELGVNQVSRFHFVSWAREILRAVLYMNAHTTAQNWMLPTISIDTLSPSQVPDILQFWVWSAYQLTSGVPLTFTGMTEGYHQAIPGYAAAVAIQTYNQSTTTPPVVGPMRLEGTLW